MPVDDLHLALPNGFRGALAIVIHRDPTRLESFGQETIEFRVPDDDGLCHDESLGVFRLGWGGQVSATASSPAPG